MIIQYFSTTKNLNNETKFNIPDYGYFGRNVILFK